MPNLEEIAQSAESVKETLFNAISSKYKDGLKKIEDTGLYIYVYSFIDIYDLLCSWYPYDD
jgi:hypothetical protein